MKFFFPDAHDYVDPCYDFLRDCTDPDRRRYHTDQYAHEILDTPPYDGMLLSKSIVDGCGDRSGKYTMAQRHRLRRVGVHRFFRVEDNRGANGEPMPIMGDCGAFSYINEPTPPISVDDAIDFYETCGFTHGQSIDHIIPNFNLDWDGKGLFDQGPPKEIRERFELTLRLAKEFLERCDSLGCSFVPIGVAQGWSPTAYVEAVRRLQTLGYSYIALGGLVPLRSEQLIEVVRQVMPVADKGVSIHLLGVLRWEHLDEIIRLGITSVDTTSPLRRAFLDNRVSYFAGTSDKEAYAAIRVPQSDGNDRMKRRILAGVIDLEEVRLLEKRCLDRVRAYSENSRTVDLEDILDDLDRYLGFIGSRGSWRDRNRRTLQDRPWAKCDCSICREIGIEVVLFRGANRNRRRGFHNLHVAYQRIQKALERHGRKPTDRTLKVSAHA